MDHVPASYSVLESKGVVWALLFVLVAFVVRSRSSNSEVKKKNKNETAPEAKGGLPLIGHLHLLGGPMPVFRTLSSMAETHGPIFSLRLGFHNTLIVSGRECRRSRTTGRTDEHQPVKIGTDDLSRVRGHCPIELFRNHRQRGNGIPQD